MKIVLGYPSPPQGNGFLQVSQNRQSFRFSMGQEAAIFPCLMGYLATWLKQDGHEVTWLDGPAQGLTWSPYWDALWAAKPDLVVWEAKTPSIPEVWAAASLVKQSNPQTKICVVGDHVTALPEESLEKPYIDLVVKGGDWDYCVRAIVSLWGSQGPKRGIVEVGTTAPLALLPVIDRELCHWRDYSRMGNYKYTPGTHLYSGRDCWWRKDGGCTFCSWTGTFKNFRVCSVDQFMAEVDHCATLGIRELFDDTGTFPAGQGALGRWFHEACEALIKFNQGKRHGQARVTLGCNMRPGALKQDDYDLLGRAGFRFILYGLESANSVTIQRINKGQADGDMESSVRMAKRAGLEPHLTCMVGYPWETRQDAQRTLDLARRLLVRGWADTLQATILMPYPGTQLFTQAQEKGWLKYGTDWAQYDMSHPVLTCPMGDVEVLAMTRGLYKACLTPQYLTRRILKLRHRSEWPYFWRSVRFILSHLTDFDPRPVH